MDAQTNLEIERPRAATELIGATFSLYRQYPWLFLVLAGAVVVPYQALDASVALELVRGAARGFLSLALNVGELALVLPLVSALHIYAVDDLRRREPPTIASVARRGIGRLSVVSPAVFLTWLGVTAGFLALIVPGVVLLLRWAVVAQTASLDAKTWRDSLTQSKRLTGGHYRHVFALLLIVFLITQVPFGVLIPVFGLKTTALAPFLIRSALSVATTSFSALATAMLYFDLTARKGEEIAVGATRPQAPRAPEGDTPRTAGDPLAPDGYTDENRPPGWYIDPENPRRMRYRLGDGAGVWSTRPAKTPKRTLAEWEMVRDTEGPR